MFLASTRSLGPDQHREPGIHWNTVRGEAPNLDDSKGEGLLRLAYGACLSQAVTCMVPFSKMWTGS